MLFVSHFMFISLLAFEVESFQISPPLSLTSELVTDGIQYTHWDLCDVSEVHSNLGGKGPDDGDENLRFRNIGTVNGTKLDLLVTVTSDKYKVEDNSKNGLAGSCMGRIQMSVKSPQYVTLKFQFVKHGTETGFKGNWLFTVMDLDAGDNSQVEKITFKTEVSKYWRSDDTKLTKSGSKTDSLAFEAKAGRKVDNPDGPFELDKQMVKNTVAVLFEDKDQFKMKFSISDVKSSADNGRSFRFSGASSVRTLTPTPVPTLLPTPEPTPEPTPVPTPLSYEDWGVCDCGENIVNNLGGLGPDDSADDDEIRFYNVFTDDNDVSYDLVVTNTTEYTAAKTKNNGASDCFGMINVKIGTSVTLKFEFLSSLSSTSLEGNFLFSLFDLDDGTSADESVTFNTPVLQYWVSDTTTLAQSGSKDSGLTFDATQKGDADDNPTSVDDLTQDQKDMSVSVEFVGVSSFSLTFSVVGEGSGGRNFMFSGWSDMLGQSTARSKFSKKMLN